MHLARRTDWIIAAIAQRRSRPDQIGRLPRCDTFGNLLPGPRMTSSLPANRVWIAQCEDPVLGASYGPARGGRPMELPEDVALTQPLLLLRSLFEQSGLDPIHRGTAGWNPLGDLISPGDAVVLKPNWVNDRNSLPDGSFECLVTHTSVIEAVLHYVVLAKPGSIIVGDAPIQDCDFDNLRDQCGLDALRDRFAKRGHEIQICDFRLTKMKGLFDDRERREPDSDGYCLFDIGDDSWLTPITDDRTAFRVANYDPDVLESNHRPGTHRYLVARPIIDADVIINLPKLKTHKKAGVTGALKNMVGINGFKEYLPHHRKGGSADGGDCYDGSRWLKKLAEDSVDRANRGRGRLSRYFFTRLAGLETRLNAALHEDDRNLDGSWHGNDTVWRMCLDLQRIVHYGTSDGRISDARQRKLITITDAIIAGERDGPLAPTPRPLGVMTLGTNVAALEWVHCMLMRIDPRKIPLVVHAFDETAWPLADFSPEDIEICVNGEILSDPRRIESFSREFVAPAGWTGRY